MPYTANKPPPALTSAQLRDRIPGWGADLNPLDRPSVPRERFDLPTGAHWKTPERQQEKQPRERSIEHQHLTPVFGTAAPLKGLSGILRRYAYRSSSEARVSHWLILLAGDRIDTWESHAASLFTRTPDNPVTQTGLRAEFTHHGLTSRIGKNRADTVHHWLDPILIAGPWIVAGGATIGLLASLRRPRQTPTADQPE